MKNYLFGIGFIAFFVFVATASICGCRKDNWKAAHLPPGYCVVTDGEGHWCPKNTEGVYSGYVEWVREVGSERKAILEAWKSYDSLTNPSDYINPKRKWKECGEKGNQ